jgi:hypothetical protein
MIGNARGQWQYLQAVTSANKSSSVVASFYQ